MMVYCVLYGFAQWLESAVGLNEEEAGLVTLPMSIFAAISSLVGTRTKSIRTPFIVSISSALVGCICLFLVDRSHAGLG